MKTKSKKVNIKDLKPEISSKLEIIEDACKHSNGIGYEMTITSGKDGTHMKGSKHYSGNAIDIRTSDMMHINATTSRIQSKLGDDYDVIFEKDHIHIEYDPE